MMRRGMWSVVFLSELCFSLLGHEARWQQCRARAPYACVQSTASGGRTGADEFCKPGQHSAGGHGLYLAMTSPGCLPVVWGDAAPDGD
jgi:hypothetical protein